jgi:hypothetical protein
MVNWKFSRVATQSVKRSFASIDGRTSPKSILRGVPAAIVASGKTRMMIAALYPPADINTIHQEQKRARVEAKTQKNRNMRQAAEAGTATQHQLHLLAVYSCHES